MQKLNKPRKTVFGGNIQPITLANLGLSPRHEAKRKMFWVLGIIIGIIVISAVLIYFLKSPAEEPDMEYAKQVVKEYEELYAQGGTQGGFSVNKFVFADFVDEDFNYYARPTAEFILGANVYVYLELVGFEQQNVGNGYKHNIKQDLIVRASLGEIIGSLSEEDIVIDSRVSDEELAYLKIRNIIPLNEEMVSPGTYTYDAIFTDELSGIRIIMTAEFLVVGREEVDGKRYGILTTDVSEVDNANETAYIETIDVFGPDGKLISELSTTDIVSGLEEKSILVKIPSEYPEGRYRVVYTVEGILTGEKSSKEEIINVERKFILKEYIFAESITDDFGYEPRDNAYYYPGETLNIYLEIVDFEQEETEDGYHLSFTEDIETYNFDGQRIEELSMKDYLVVDEKRSDRFGAYRIQNPMDLGSDMQSGEYTIKLTFNDQISGESFTKEIPFWIVEVV